MADELSHADLAKMVGEIKATLCEHIEREEHFLGNAFPGGDPVAHRLAHEAMMEAARAQAKFWAELRLDLAKKSLWGLLIIILGLAAAGVTVKLGLFGGPR